MKHETIIPLIGGVAIASEKVFGKPPERIYSYDAFGPNDSHLINYYQQRNLDIPYDVLDASGSDSRIVASKGPDVISTVCPCAGLSTLNHHSSADNPLNDWMARTAEFILGQVKPKVFWGENAPTFAGKTGEKIRKRIYEIGRKNGYTMSIYKTKSLDHGLPQYRGRCFYFFWKEKGNVPVFNTYRREVTPIETVLDGVTSNFQREVHTKRTPTEEVYYKYILDVMHPGVTHHEFLSKILDKSYDSLQYILQNGVTYEELIKYYDSIGNTKEADQNRKRKKKIDAGGGVMIRTIYLPHYRTGAFVGYLPYCMTHTREDRFLDYREMMTIMGLPDDFELLNPRKNLNHICQNVPVTTASDMASEVARYLDGKSTMISANLAYQVNDPNKKIEVWDDVPVKELEFS